MNKSLDVLFFGKPLWLIVLAGFVLMAIVGVIDYLVGYEISFFIFYAIPVTLAAWYGSNKLGYFFACMSILAWFYVDQVSGHPYSQGWIPFWNGGVRLVFFLLVAYWVSSIQLHLKLESKLARVDGLTGCLNAAAFKEKCDTVLLLSHRFKYPVALGYIDLDNFKQINDAQGHSEGDRVLQAVADTMMQAVRGTDIVGRMGGDEFAILLPNADIGNARIVFDNLRNKLLKCVQLNGWPIGFSMGVAVFSNQTNSTDKAIGLADALMYRVKKSGKNNVIYEAAPDSDSAQ